MRDQRRPLVAAAVGILTAIPPLVVASAIRQYAVDVPLQDQWPFAREVVDWHRGEYTLRQFWFPNGQHRVALPKLVMLLLAERTGWDVRAEMWLDFAFMLLALALLGGLARRTLRPVVGSRWSWVLPPASAMLFSLAGSQSWTWGWMMAAFLNVVGVVLAAWALGRHGARPAGVVLMTVGALVAALSFLSGFALFVLVPLALVLMPFDPATPGRRPAVVAACAVFAVFGVFYAVTYPRMLLKGSGPPLAFDPLGLASFTVHYLGSPLGGRDAATSFAWGVAGIVLLGGCAVVTWLRAPALRGALLPWLLVAAYVVAAGMITGVGRMGQGIGLALSSRYTTISGLFWASLAPCALLAADAVGLFETRRWIRTSVAVSVAALLVLALHAWDEVRYAALGGLYGRQQSALSGRACIVKRANPQDACLRLLNRTPRIVRRAYPELAAERLGPFRDAPPEPAGGPAGSGQGVSTTLPTFRRS